MSILGSFVAYKRTLVAEDRTSNTTRNVIAKIFGRLPRHDTKISYQYEQQVYHFLVENEVVYGCFTSNEYENRIVYGFLEKCKEAFKTMYAGGADRCPRPEDVTPANCAKFKSSLVTIARTFNTDPRAAKIGQIKDQLETTRQVMLENLETVVDRGDRIDGLCDRTGLLREEANQFQSNSRLLKSAQLKHNLILIAAVIGVMAVLILAIVFMACGITFKKC